MQMQTYRMQTQIYRKQHEVLGNVLETLASGLENGNPDQIRKDVARLAGVLKVHLVIEDKSIYPSLLRHPDPAIREIAQECQKAMGDPRTTFNPFYEKWIHGDAIERSRAEFFQEARTVVEALQARIHLEDENLTALIEQSEVEFV